MPAFALRRVDPEILDGLAVDDPRAIQSRRDLRLCNVLMFQPAILTRLLRRHSKPPRTIADIGTGDGTFALSLARRLAPHWPGVRIDLVDRRPAVSEATLAAFAGLGWRAESLPADVFAFFGNGRRFDVVTANLFLHHFPETVLGDLLDGIARSADVFVAGEPRRGAAGAIGCRLLPLFGCNDVTRHDSAASVRAGFRGAELSALWPKANGWYLFERGAPPFTHSFAARRNGAHV